MLTDWLLRDLSMAPLVPEELIDAIPAAAMRRNQLPLSEQERRVLQAASFGMHVPETAHICGVSESTVVTQIKSARFKLAAKDVTHAVAQAISGAARSR
jgi:DNA-binding CsgD family transcriptional regulator